MAPDDTNYAPEVAPSGDTLLCQLPDDVQASIEVRDRWFASTTAPSDGEFFVVEDILRWEQGQAVRVAFLGGSTQLHRRILEATADITDSCNISLDFGFDEETETFRSWSLADTVHAAEIRVSFDMGGYWSLVGRDSIAPNIGLPGEPIGGRANQRSLNLSGFHIQPPGDAERIIRHEFLHALGFHHEHQSPSSGCEEQFRWEDDPGYQPTTSADGVFIPDFAGRRPGIYTYLAGAPNKWPRNKVDHNLRRMSSSDITFSTFDRASIMLYRFQPFFYRTNPSPCAPSGQGVSLSDGDRAGLARLYPNDQESATVLRETQSRAFESVLGAPDLHEETREFFESLRTDE
jgi:hypothetical protein